MASLPFVCPVCRGALVSGSDKLLCPSCNLTFHEQDGIWRFLPPDRLARYEQFTREYETVRRAEGRVSPNAAYYRALPFRDQTGLHAHNWRIRARSFQTLLDRTVKPLEAKAGRPLIILDLGAGNGWLSYQMAKRSHHAFAVDLLVNDFDGLGCHVHYDASFTPVQGEFERLPFPDGHVDLAVFNASLHYATDYTATLAEALRVLHHGGAIAIVDSPVYNDASSGAQMVREREQQFLQQYGFASNSIPSENYLTYDRLAQLERQLGIKWERLEPFYGLAWALRPFRARLRGRREPAKFMVIVARRDRETGGRGDGEKGTKQNAQGTQDGREVGEPAPRSTYPNHPAHPVHPVFPGLQIAMLRLLTKLRYRLLSRGRYNALTLEMIAGKPILVLPGVFNPKLLRTGEILVRVLDSRLVPAGSAVLDMGTGSGVGAIFAAGWASRVAAVDMNPEAVRCARINTLLNRVDDRVEVLEGDLFTPVQGRRFDVVLFNPPYYRGVPRDKLDMAWRSPDVIERFAAELPEHLSPGGHALVVLSTDGEQSAFLEAFGAAGLTTGIVARRDLGNEVVTVYHLGNGGRGTWDGR